MIPRLSLKPAKSPIHQPLELELSPPEHLDVIICRNEDGNLRFKVYKKDTYLGHYLRFDSHYPLEHKHGIIHTLTHISRATILVTDEEDREEELAHLEQSSVSQNMTSDPASNFGVTKRAPPTP